MLRAAGSLAVPSRVAHAAVALVAMVFDKVTVNMASRPSLTAAAGPLMDISGGVSSSTILPVAVPSRTTAPTGLDKASVIVSGRAPS